MRAIDADAFDERVRAAGGMSEEELTEDFKDGVQAVLYMLSNQPTIQPEPHWIPVTERLPNRDELVLVTYKTTSKIHLCKYLDDGSENSWWSYIDDCCAWNNVILAWMPLPEPFKGVTE